jgi:hypothetical protein
MKAIKPTSQKTDAQKAFAFEENQADKEAALKRMAEQRRARLSATALVRAKNRG